MGGSCPRGTVKQVGLCYPPCREEFRGVGPICWGVCPPGFTDFGISCVKPKPYGRGAGHISKERCERSDDHGAKEYGCEKYGLLWYPRCAPNHHNFGCCICSPNCPHGFTDTGEFCTKPSYGRGAGKIPNVSYIIWIVLAIVVLLIIGMLILALRILL